MSRQEWANPEAKNRKEEIENQARVEDCYGVLTEENILPTNLSRILDR